MTRGEIETSSSSDSPSSSVCACVCGQTFSGAILSEGQRRQHRQQTQHLQHVGDDKSNNSGGVWSADKVVKEREFKKLSSGLTGGGEILFQRLGNFVLPPPQLWIFFSTSKCIHMRCTCPKANLELCLFQETSISLSHYYVRSFPRPISSLSHTFPAFGPLSRSALLALPIGGGGETKLKWF